jgi:hypothetical protein
MANEKISDLTNLAASDVADDDKLVIVDTSVPETKRVDVSNFRHLKKVGTAFVGGNQTGNTRGAYALDIQSTRSFATQVASGDNATAIGQNNTASGPYKIAIGRNNTSSGSNFYGGVSIGSSNTSSGDYNACAIGISNTASGYYSVSVGYHNTSSGTASMSVGRQNTSSNLNSIAIGLGNTASGYYSVAVGYVSTVSARDAVVVGRKAKTAVEKTVEIGWWSTATVRGSAIRAHGLTGMVQFTIQNRSAQYGDGGTTAGSEADNQVGREMYAIRRDGDTIKLDVNVAGTMKTLTLGTAT